MKMTKMKTITWRQNLKLDDPWMKLGVGDASRVNSTGRFDFFWIVLEDGMPGLMLRLSDLPKPTHRLPKLKNLVISFRSAASGSVFVIGLKDLSQSEVFKTLCMDVVAAAEVASDINDALQRSIRRTHRWQHLLRGGKTIGLSVEEQRGLIGELAFLRKLADGLGPEAAIDAWAGPTGAPKDFEFMGTCVEIKARRVAAKPFVSISSAEQLADVPGCRLFLSVLNVASAVSPEGLTLHHHVNMTAKVFNEVVSTLDKWEEALYSTGYASDHDYENRHWRLCDSVTYEIINGFPRIESPLARGIEMVKYSLSLDACAEFETNVDLINIIKEGIRNE